MANWTGNQFVDSLLLGVKWQNHNITYKFDNSGGAWNDIEKKAMKTALDAWASVANITFTETTGTANLNEKLEYNPGSPGALGAHGVLINYGSPGIGQISSSTTTTGTYNYAGYGWDWTDPNGGLSKGGFGYLTIVHEIGHALGLDHTQRWAERGDPHWFPGVDGDPQTDYGDNGLNQDVFSVMSYVNGFMSKPVGLNGHSYGYVAGPMAFDIAAIQFLYGAKAANTGNNNYVLPTANKTGTFWSCIWDTGGTDTIISNATTSGVINLRAATLLNDAYGGGGISTVNGIYGGFTIAYGVVIENATGGKGAESIIGNHVNNVLNGRGGHDTLFGNDGNDILIGGSGGDMMFGGAGINRVQYSDSTEGLTVDLMNASANTGIAAGDSYFDIQNLYGSDFNDSLRGNNSGNTIWGREGNDKIYGRGGHDVLRGDDGNDILIGGSGGDKLEGGEGEDRVEYSDSTEGLLIDFERPWNNTGIAAGDSYLSIENLLGSAFNDNLRGDGLANRIWGRDGNDKLYGRGGNDRLEGDAGNDSFYGGAGRDTLIGGAGRDTFFFDTALGSSNIDTISDFNVADDTIRLENAVFTNLTITGTLPASWFKKAAAATDSNDRIIYNSANGGLYYDADGSGAGKAIQFARISSGLSLTHNDFLIV